MKVVTVLGTRPEIIRLSRVIPALDAHAEHVLVHTGQNFDDRLSELFFRELGVRPPDEFMNVRAASFADQIAQIVAKSEQLFLKHRPDRLMILGDTNSGLSAIVARRLGIPVYHLEAGNRCFDDRVPEEVNRRIIDHSSSVLLPYTQGSRENLLREGIPSDRIYVTGNPIYEVMESFAASIDGSTALQGLGLAERGYFLVTVHRAENVDHGARLSAIIESLRRLAKTYGLPVVCSTHPRTRSKLKEFGISDEGGAIRFLEPIGFFDFVRLERSAFCILSDSGTVQEEACILRTPTVTLRDVTERPETVACGSNVLGGCDPELISRLVRMVTEAPSAWSPPPEYLAKDVARIVTRIVLGYRLPDRAEVDWRSRPGSRS